MSFITVKGKKHINTDQILWVEITNPQIQRDPPSSSSDAPHTREQMTVTIKFAHPDADLVLIDEEANDFMGKFNNLPK